MLDILNYEVIRIIWWLILGVLLSGFAILEGFDMGVAMLIPFVGKTNSERRVMINTIGPVWEGNQVWLLLGAGSLLAVWPHTYAVSATCLFLGFLAVLLGLILRPVGFDFRKKVDNNTWRNVWDACLFLGGLLPSLVLGVAVGNLVTGVAFDYDIYMRITNKQRFFALFSPFALICGMLSVSMMLMQGASYLTLKAGGVVADRCKKILPSLAILCFVLFSTGGYLVSTHVEGYQIVSYEGSSSQESLTKMRYAESNPLKKTVVREKGLWMKGILSSPWKMIAPIIANISILGVFFLSRFKKYRITFIVSSLSIIGFVSTVGTMLFPFLLPSSLNPDVSLLIWDASSSHNTMLAMLIAVIILLPIVLFYTSWLYKVMRSKITEQDIAEDKSLY